MIKGRTLRRATVGFTESIPAKPPEMRLENKVAVVTGAGGEGSGRAIALRFGRRGAAVVVSDIQEEGARETVRQIEASGGRASMLKANVRREADIRALIAHAEQMYGG